VVNLVVEHDTIGFVTNEIGWLNSVCGLHEEVLVQCPGFNSKHKVSSCLHVCVTGCLSPHLNSKAGKGIFAGAFQICFTVVSRVRAVTICGHLLFPSPAANNPDAQLCPWYQSKHRENGK
jgi:hypothetical protein